MKYFILFICVIFTGACANKKSTTVSSPSTSTPSAPALSSEASVSTGYQESMIFKVAPKSSLAALSPQSNHSFLLGKLVSPSHIEIGGKRLMLTTISMQMAVAPESGYLKIPSNKMGKYAIVQGFWSGTLYEAGVVCVFDNPPSQAMLRDFEAGTKNVMDYCR